MTTEEMTTTRHEASKPDFYHVSLPMYPIMNYFHGGASSLLRYDRQYLCGPWYMRYRYEGNTDVIIPQESLISYGMRFIRLLEQNDAEFVEMLYAKYVAIVSLADRLERLNYEEIYHGIIPKKSDFYDEYAELFPRVIGIAYVTDTAFEVYIQEQGIDLTQIRIPGESFIRREERELKKVAEISDETERKAALANHAARYSYIHSNYKGYHPIDMSYFSDRLKAVSEKEFSDVSDQIQKPANIKEWIGFSTYIRDERKRCNMLFNALYGRYLKRECQEYDLSYQQAVMLTPDEFEEGKRDGRLRDYEGQRIVVTSHETGFRDIDESEWDRVAKEAASDTLFGTSASKGCASGSVRIVLGRKDFEKVKHGDVIVASMTRPEYASVLKRASAIITNEGSVTCHAAIVSRELGIPCIIGTQNATRVLHDGDLVEVDADRGIITVLETHE